MAPSDDKPIWYASYGSNCLAQRFAAYLTGGQADGARFAERGARDARLAKRSEPQWFPHTVRFLGNSEKWGGGGVAFLDHETGAPSPGRRYLITRGQFNDVAAQESRRPSYELPFDELEIGVVHAVGTGFYDGLLALDPVDDIPVVTFTSPMPLAERPANAPSAAYLGTIARGLNEIHPAVPEEIARWLMAAPGVAGRWTENAIISLIQEGPNAS